MRRELSALLLATAISGPAFAAAPTWVVSETSAGVTILHAGGARPATRGLHVEAGDIISTGANARAVIVRGDQYAVVAPGTRLEVAGSDGPGLVQFFEKAGNVVFSIKKSSTPHFGVQTPYLAAVVKGTTFSVTVEDTGAAVQVVEGAVEVATVDGGAKQMVTPGAIATVDANDLRRLVLQGATTKVIRSTTPETPPPRSPTPAAVATAHSEATGVAAAFAPVGGDAAPMTTAEAPTRAAYTESVAAMVEDNSQSIGKLSGGLVSADSAMRVAVATIAPTPADRAIQSAQLVSVAARVSAGDPNSAGDVTKASGPAAPGPGADTGKGADPAAPGPGADTGKGAGPAAAGPGFDTGKGAGPAETGPGSDTGKGAGPAATGTGADNGKGAGPAAPGPGSDNGKGTGRAAPGSGSDNGRDADDGKGASGTGKGAGKRGGHS